MLLWIPILLYISFSSVEGWAVFTKHANLKQIKSEYLNRMSIQGRLTAADEAEMRSRITNIGCTIVSIAGPMESNGDLPILRTNDPATSNISLRISATPTPAPITLGPLLRMSNPNMTFNVGGDKLSERVN